MIICLFESSLAFILTQAHPVSYLQRIFSGFPQLFISHYKNGFRLKTVTTKTKKKGVVEKAPGTPLKRLCKRAEAWGQGYLFCVSCACRYDTYLKKYDETNICCTNHRKTQKSKYERSVSLMLVCRIPDPQFETH